MPEMLKFDGATVKYLCNEYSMTQQVLANKLNISQTTLSLKLNGRLKFDESEIKQIAFIFGKTFTIGG